MVLLQVRASNFGNAKTVRLVNTTTTGYLVTLEQADGTDIGTMTLMGGESVVIHKNPTDKLFAPTLVLKRCCWIFTLIKKEDYYGKD